MARKTGQLNVMMTLRKEGFNKALALANRQLTQFARKAEEAGRTMTMAFSLPTAAIGGAAISAFAEMDKLRKSLTAVAGSSEEAEKQLERLRTLALEPGLDLEQATRAVIRLQSVGYAASEAERTILQMSKAVTLAGGTADDLDEVIRQMTQMEGRGTILREDWNVIAERVPAINIALQDAFGTTNIEAIRETGISVKDFNQAIVEAISRNEKFQAVQGGVANAITNFQSSIRQSLGVLGEAIDKNVNITAVLDKLSGFVNRVAKGFADMDPRLQSVILGTAAFLAALGPVLLAFGSMARIIPTITLGLSTMRLVTVSLLSPIKLIGSLILSAAGQIGFLNTALTALRVKAAAAWLALSGPIGWIVAGVVAIGVAVVAMYQKWDTFRGIVKGTWEAIKQFFYNWFPEKQDVEDRGRTIGEAYKDGFNEGVADLHKGLPKTTDAESRQFGYEQAQAVTGRAMPFPMRVPIARREPEPERPSRTIPTGTGTRRKPVEPLAEIPTLTKQIMEAGKLAIANESVAMTTRSMNAAFAESRIRLDEVFQATEKTGTKFNWLKEGLEGLQTIYEQTLDNMVSLAEQGELTMANFAKAIAGSVRKIIGLLIKEGVAAAVSNALKNPAISLNPALIPLIAAGAGALAQTAFNSVLNAVKVPALAEGGLAYGPTMAMVGDNPGARSNPEVIAPLSKLQGMLEQSGGIAIGEFRLRGEDLLLSVTRTQNRQNRYK